MVSDITLTLLLMTVLIIKHYICDFPIRMQTPWMFLNKGTYGHPGGLAHAAVQATVSLSIYGVLALAGSPIEYLIYAAMFLWSVEFTIHYHMDWFKIWTNKKYELTPDKSPMFWNLLGIDQLVHYMTYVGMIAFLGWY